MAPPLEGGFRSTPEWQPLQEWGKDTRATRGSRWSAGPPPSASTSSTATTSRNHVQYLGEELRRGTFRPIANCAHLAAGDQRRATTTTSSPRRSGSRRSIATELAGRPGRRHHRTSQQRLANVRGRWHLSPDPAARSTKVNGALDPSRRCGRGSGGRPRQAQAHELRRLPRRLDRADRRRARARLRRRRACAARLLPGWSGAPARLAEVVLGLSLLVVTLELVGRRRALPPRLGAGRLRAGRARRRACRRADRRDPAARPRGPPDRARDRGRRRRCWSPRTGRCRTQLGLDIGMYLPNTTWHNAPFAARFVQDAPGRRRSTSPRSLQPDGLVLPAELRAAPFRRRSSSSAATSSRPLINIGWMALCLLAAWCFGRPYGGGADRPCSPWRWSSTRRCCCSTSRATPRTTSAGLFFLLAVGGDPRQRRRPGARRDAGRRGPVVGGGPALAPLLPTRRADRRRPGGGPGARHQAQPARALRAAHARGDRGRAPGLPRPDCPDLGR